MGLQGVRKAEIILDIDLERLGKAKRHVKIDALQTVGVKPAALEYVSGVLPVDFVGAGILRVSKFRCLAHSGRRCSLS
jgi:hypothetical protein